MVTTADLQHPLSKLLNDATWTVNIKPIICEPLHFTDKMFQNLKRALQIDWESANLQERKEEFDLEEGTDIVGFDMHSTTYTDLRAIFENMQDILMTYTDANGKTPTIDPSEYQVEKKYGKWQGQGIVRYTK